MDYETEIDMLLFDQEKIVSYKEVSTRFDITPNQAKKILGDYVTNKRKSKDSKKEFYVTYLVVAQDKGTQATKFFLVNEPDMEKTEKEYRIISRQIHSLENKPIEDFNLICSSDLDASNNINRKSNLNVIFNDDDDNAMAQMVLGESSNTIKQPAAAQQANSTTSKVKTESVESKKPVAEAPAVKHPQQHKENISSKPTVKDEPKDEEGEAEKKKAKLNNPEPEKKKAPAASTHSAPAKKTDAKAKPAQQASIMSFFKKS